MSGPAKSYDEAYFDKWYRAPATRVHAAAEVARRVHLAGSVTEYVLGRPLRSVLDVGCGEGAWLAPLRRFRARVRYAGVDPSEYAVAKYGRRRNIRLGTVADLRSLRMRPADLVVCADFLNYLDDAALRDGLEQVAERVLGVAYLELWTDRDEMTGDLGGWQRRPASWYRRLFRRVGLVRVAPHCYVTAERAGMLSAHEVAR